MKRYFLLCPHSEMRPSVEKKEWPAVDPGKCFVNSILVFCSIYIKSPKRKTCHRSIIGLINVSKLSQYLADTDYRAHVTISLPILLPLVSVFASLPWWWLRISSIQEITPSGTQRGQFKCEGVKGQGMPHILLTRRYFAELDKESVQY